MIESMSERSRVVLPPAVGGSFEVYVNGVRQVEGSDFTREGEARLDRDGVPPAERRMLRSADLRYHGQSHELTVRGGDEHDLRERFEALHEERYGHRDPEGEVELVTVRVTGRLPAQPLEFGAAAGERVEGPTVVRLPEATLVVPEGWSGATDDTGTLILERPR